MCKLRKKRCIKINLFNFFFFFSILCLCPVLQHFPVSEVSRCVGVGSSGWFCARVQVWVPVAVLAFHTKRLRLLQISGAGKRWTGKKTLKQLNCTFLRILFLFVSHLGLLSLLRMCRFHIGHHLPPFYTCSVAVLCCQYLCVGTVCLAHRWFFYLSGTIKWARPPQNVHKTNS